MPALIDTIAGRKVDAHRPCPRFVVDEEGWRSVSARLAERQWCLLGLWGDTGAVHMAVLDEAPSPAQTAVVSLDCPAGRFPSVGALNPAAIRLERAIRSMFARSQWDYRIDGRGLISVFGMSRIRSRLPHAYPPLQAGEA